MVDRAERHPARATRTVVETAGGVARPTTPPHQPARPAPDLRSARPARPAPNSAGGAGVLPPRPPLRPAPVSLVLVANRAPIRQTPSGWAPALGGLASALLPVLEDRGGAWVAMQEPGERTPLVQRYPDDAPAFSVRRVPLEEAEYAAFYQGMANRVLWPLAHYLVEHVEPERTFRDAYRPSTAGSPTPPSTWRVGRATSSSGSRTTT